MTGELPVSHMTPDTSGFLTRASDIGQYHDYLALLHRDIGHWTSLDGTIQYHPYHAARWAVQAIRAARRAGWIDRESQCTHHPYDVPDTTGGFICERCGARLVLQVDEPDGRSTPFIGLLDDWRVRFPSVQYPRQIESYVLSRGWTYRYIPY